MKTEAKEICPCKNLIIRFVDKINRKAKLKPYEVHVRSRCITGFLQITCPLCKWYFVIQ